MVTFTRVAWLVLIYGIASDSHAGLGVACCCFTGALLSFSVAPLLDASVYSRMRFAHSWSLLVFYCGHYLLHIAPVLMLARHIDAVHPVHGLLASCLHVCWFNSIDANSVYVPMLRQEWRILMLVSVVTELATPYVLSLTG